MKHIAHLVLALALVLVATRDSSASPPSATAVVFEAVDAVTVTGDDHLRIEGIVQGESEARTINFKIGAEPYTYNGSITSGAAAQNCHRQAMFVFAHPGRYALELDYQGPVYSYSIATCTIRRR